MSVWFKLANKEFWLPFAYWKKEGCPGGRDFLWLTLFLILLMLLSLMLHATGEGVLNRFVDVLLGKKEHHGVPIWVIPGLSTDGGSDYIDFEVIKSIQKLDYSVYPYREIYGGHTHFVGLPDKLAWKKLNENSPGFDGWAIKADDPLWMREKNFNKLPLQIVINKTLFARHFDYQVYRNALQSSLPGEIISQMPESLSPDKYDTLEKLWLKLSNGYFPFEIVWVDYIYTMQKLAFLFPLETLHAIQMQDYYPDILYFPEAEGGLGKRALVIEFSGDANDVNVHQFVSKLCGVSVERLLNNSMNSAALNLPLKDINACSQIVNSRGDIRIDFKYPVQSSRIEGYANQFKLQLFVSKALIGDKLSYDDENIFLPCGKLPDDLVDQQYREQCNRDSAFSIPLNVTDYGNGFVRALVYIPQRTQLFTAVEQLKMVHDHALTIHSTYQDSLNKFGFLSRMIESLRQPFGLVLFFALVVLVGIQLLTLVGHRRHRYGMFLSKGFAWWQIYAMLFTQIIMAVTISVIMSVFITFLIRFQLGNAIAAIASEYKETLSINDLNLMPLGISDYVAVAVSILMLSLTLVAIVLYFMPLRHRTQPAMLFQS